MVQLPASVMDRIEMQPMVDLMLTILREKFPDVPIRSRIPGEPHLWPTQAGVLVLVRRVPSLGAWDGDSRFVDTGTVAIHVFCYGEDADERCELVSEAVRVALRDAQREQKLYPKLGVLSRIDLDDEATRKADWATATGPVQYADLPAGWERYESQYDLMVRRDVWTQ